MKKEKDGLTCFDSLKCNVDRKNMGDYAAAGDGHDADENEIYR